MTQGNNCGEQLNQLFFSLLIRSALTSFDFMPLNFLENSVGESLFFTK